MPDTNDIRSAMDKYNPTDLGKTKKTMRKGPKRPGRKAAVAVSANREDAARQKQIARQLRDMGE